MWLRCEEHVFVILECDQCNTHGLDVYRCHLLQPEYFQLEHFQCDTAQGGGMLIVPPSHFNQNLSCWNVANI
jgi:hypothetical protein